jgi:hypothetical protein
MFFIEFASFRENTWHEISFDGGQFFIPAQVSPPDLLCYNGFR